MPKTQEDTTTDQKIARCIIETPAATIREIASETGMSDSTVQRHREKLITDGVLLPNATVVKNWPAVGFKMRFRIDILINQLELRNETKGGGPECEGCPDDIKPAKPINSQEQLAAFIKEKLVNYVAWRIETGKEASDRPAAKAAVGASLTAEQFRSAIMVQDVTILLGHHADLSVTVRANSMTAIRKFVTSGLRMMRGITATSTAHEVWSYMEVDL
jgi:DNA-binding Lrp family transcriptional regulator